MGKLDKKVAIVTGGGKGIGREVALEFARAGANIIVAGRNRANLETVTNEIKALGRQALPVATDVSSLSQVRRMCQQAADHFGRIDILVNNSGIWRRGLLMELSEHDLNDMIDTNLKGVFYCIQAAGKYMLEQKYGKVINIASIAGLRANMPGASAYGATKAAVVLLTKAAALELGPHGINVNCIAPGPIDTPLQREGRTEQQYEDWKERSRKRAIVGRVGTPQDIASLALFLASDDSSFMCGETVVMDGGIVCQGYLYA